MREIKQLVKFWPRDIVRDSFGRVFRVERLYVTVDPEFNEELLTVYVCSRAYGLYREEEFSESELFPVRGEGHE